VVIELAPYPDIRIKGIHENALGEEQDSLFRGAFLNLDGKVLTHLKFMRKFSEAQRSFVEFF